MSRLKDGRHVRASIIEPVGGHGGMDYYDFGLCGGLHNAGVEISLYTCDETSVKVEAPYKVKMPYRQIYSGAPAWLRGIRYIRGSWRALLETKLDRSQIAHFHLFQVGGLEFYNVVLAKLLGLRVVITAHDVRSFVESRSLPWLSRIVYMLSDRIIAQSDVSERELKSLLQQPETKIATIPHGNYVHAIEQVPTRQEARARLGLPQGVKVLLFFGQIKQVKGLDVLLRALPRVIEEQPDTVLLVAGKVWKDDFMLYQELIDSLNIANNCVLHVNFIPDSEVAAYYASADVVILPYRRIYQSGVLLMAMSYGKPVVVSDIEGMTEVVTDGVNGYVFHSGNAKALARKLIEVSSDLVEARRVGKNAFSYVREHHDWDEVGRATAACYQAVMEE